MKSPRRPKVFQPPPLSPDAVVGISTRKAAALIRKHTGRPFSGKIITAHIKLGAPVNADGTINLMAYTAWLVKATPHA